MDTKTKRAITKNLAFAIFWLFILGIAVQTNAGWVIAIGLAAGACTNVAFAAYDAGEDAQYQRSRR